MEPSQEQWAESAASLQAFFRRRVRGDDEARDLVQDTLLRVQRGLQGLRQPEHLSAWIFRIARRVLADHYRGSAPSSEARALSDDEASVLADGDEQGEHNLNAEVEGWLRGLLQQLPPQTREALELVELEGRPQAQVAEHLGLSLSAAKSRIQRGRERLRQLRLPHHFKGERHRGSRPDHGGQHA